MNTEVEEVERGPDDGLDELLDAWGGLQLRCEINKQAAMQDFIGVDSELITDGALTLEEILAEVLQVKEEPSHAGDSEQIEAEEEEPVITRQEAKATFNLARRFVEKNSADPAILSHSFTKNERKLENKAN